MTQTLKAGDRGALVALLQLALERAGQMPGALDGIFGAQTAAAVACGFMHYDQDVRIAACVLNRAGSERHVKLSGDLTDRDSFIAISGKQMQSYR